MRKFAAIRDERGASMIEFALMAPLLVSLVIGAAQMGILFFANAGLQHAIGEGARVAMIFPRPTDATIRQAVLDSKYGLDSEFLVGNPIITHGEDASGADFADITWSYKPPLDFIFFSTPPVTLQHTRRAFLQDPAAAGGGGGGGGGGTTTGGTSTGSTGSTSTGSTSTGGTSTGSTSTGGTSTGGDSTTSGGSTTTSSSTTSSSTGSTSSTSGGSTTTTSGGSTTTGGSTTSTGGDGSSGSNNGSSGSNNGSSGNGKGSDKVKNK